MKYDISYDEALKIAEYATIKRIITETYPTGIVSLVCDSFDYWSVLTNVLPQLKTEIMNRQPDSMGFNKTVIRPDSGDPVHIICGYKKPELYIYDNFEVAYEYAPYELTECEVVQVSGIWYKCGWINESDFEIDKTITYTEEEVNGSIQVLWELFGGTANDKGYKVLDQHIGLIYGDSITLDRAEEILKRLEAKGFSADNVVFGVGSYTYQYNTRDTLGFAMKATNITKDGVDIPLFKDPKTDNGTKKSAKGLLAVRMRLDDTNTFVLLNNVSREYEQSGALTTLFKDGKFYKHETLEEIRNRVLGMNVDALAQI